MFITAKVKILMLSVAALLPACATAQTASVMAHPVQIGLTSDLRPADISARNADPLLSMCSHRNNDTSGVAGLVAFGLNFLFEEVLEAFTRSRADRIESLTETFAGVRNYVSFSARANGPNVAPMEMDCLVVDQTNSTDQGTTFRSTFIFGVLPVGETAIALQPLFAQVNETSANARVGRNESRNVSAQLGLTLSAVTGGNCAADERNCAPAEVVLLGAPQFAFRNLAPGVALTCLSQGEAGCASMSGQSPAFPIARAGTPTSIGGLASLTSVTAPDARLRQQMWERHRAALLDLLNSTAADLVE